MTGAVTVERDASGAHELVVLDNGLLRVTAAPALGGRILSVRHLGREHLYRNPRLLGRTSSRSRASCSARSAGR
ncbi:hypothetical protein HFP72_27905 [Nocardiopsis sp. ARC36]